MSSVSAKFERPPIIELVLGVQFAPLQGLTTSHYGWFWKSFLGEEWVRAGDAPPVLDQFETFGESRSSGIPDLRVLLGQASSPRRVQFTTESGERMVQVQPTRFHYNWQSKGQAYPSYHEVRKEFDANFERFCRFVAEAKLGELQPNQWEITYVDHIPKGDLWDEPKNWHRIFPGLLAPGREMGGTTFEGVAGEWHFEIVPQKGRLHFTVQYGRVGEKAEPTLILNSTARGPIGKEVEMDLAGGLTLGHEKTLQAFLQITSPEAQKIWKKVNL